MKSAVWTTWFWRKGRWGAASLADRYSYAVWPYLNDWIGYNATKPKTVQPFMNPFFPLLFYVTVNIKVWHLWTNREKVRSNNEPHGSEDKCEPLYFHSSDLKIAHHWARLNGAANDREKNKSYHRTMSSRLQHVRAWILTTNCSAAASS